MRYACQQCREEVAVRDELSHLERARLAAHLEVCTPCRSFANRWAATIESARASVPSLTDARKDAILDLVGVRCEPPRKRGIPHRRAAALALPAVLFLFTLVRPGGEVGGPPPLPRNAARPLPAAPPPVPAAAAHEPEAPRPVVADAGRRQWRPTGTPEGRGRSRSAHAPSMEIAPSRPGVDPLELYAEAERVLEEGRLAAAARLLEDLVARAPDTPEAQTARLELGMLYAGDLKQPARAVSHLSAFVAREREPSARGAAKGLLCQLLPAMKRTGACWPGFAALGSK